MPIDHDLETGIEPEADTESGLIIADSGRRDEIAMYLYGQTEAAKQWLEYTFEQVEAGNKDEATRGLTQAHAILGEMEQQAELVARVMGAQIEMINEIAQARDDAERQVAELEDEVQTIEERTMESAQEALYEDLDMDYIHDALEDEREEAIQRAIGSLRALGDVAEADALEEKHRLAQAQRTEVESILDEAEKRVREHYMAQWQRQADDEDKDENDFDDPAA